MHSHLDDGRCSLTADGACVCDGTHEMCFFQFQNTNYVHIHTDANSIAQTFCWKWVRERYWTVQRNTYKFNSQRWDEDIQRVSEMVLQWRSNLSKF